MFQKFFIQHSEPLAGYMKITAKQTKEWRKKTKKTDEVKRTKWNETWEIAPGVEGDRRSWKRETVVSLDWRIAATVTMHTILHAV